jgi:hypothetical protein
VILIFITGISNKQRRSSLPEDCQILVLDCSAIQGVNGATRR